MRQRRAFISFPEKHGLDVNLLNSQKVLDGLNIGFRVKVYGMAGVPSECTIDIYNLNREDLQFLTTSVSKWMSEPTLIQLYAGYDDDIDLLFGGQIMEAPPYGYPDLSLHLRCLPSATYMTKTIDIQKSNLKLVDLIDYTSSVTGYPVNIPAQLRRANETLNKKIDNFSYTGSVYNLMDKIQQMCGGFTINGKSVFLSTMNDNTYVWTPENNQKGEMLKVSEKSGMIGVPSLSAYGVDVKILMNTKIHTGDTIYLESVRVPQANGKYYVTQITHEGELRGNAWYTTLNCTRYDALLGESDNGTKL